MQKNSKTVKKIVAIQVNHQTKKIKAKCIIPREDDRVKGMKGKNNCSRDLLRALILEQNKKEIGKGCSLIRILKDP